MKGMSVIIYADKIKDNRMKISKLLSKVDTVKKQGDEQGKKHWLPIISSLFLGVAFSVTAVPWQTETKGAGSISLEPVGDGVYQWLSTPRVNQLPQSTIYTTDNIDKTQTNDWASSVVFNRYSEAPTRACAITCAIEVASPRAIAP